MKVFISWSGDRSRRLASALRDWLPLLLDGVDPWMSETDIGAGERWAPDLSGALESAEFGLLCLTRENLKAPWLLFEAGALAKSVQHGKVVPLLLGLEATDLDGPLSAFQAKRTREDDIRDMVLAIHRAKGTGNAEILRDRFNTYWNRLSTVIDAIPLLRNLEAKPIRTDREVLDGLLVEVRGIGKLMRDAPNMIIDAHDVIRGSAVRAAIRAVVRSDGPLTNKLAQVADIAGHLMPWLPPVLTEAARSISRSDKGALDRTIGQLANPPSPTDSAQETILSDLIGLLTESGR